MELADGVAEVGEEGRAAIQNAEQVHGLAFVVLRDIEGELLHAVNDGAVADEEMGERVGVVRGNKKTIERNHTTKRERKFWSFMYCNFREGGTIFFTSHRGYREEDDELQW